MWHQMIKFTFQDCHILVLVRPACLTRNKGGDYRDLVKCSNLIDILAFMMSENKSRDVHYVEIKRKNIGLIQKAKMNGEIK